MKYLVKWAHQGDKHYDRGDTREATEHEVRHLVKRGVLEEIKPKAAAPVKNKAEPAVQNKSAK
jgi:hypothetical protein